MTDHTSVSIPPPKDWPAFERNARLLFQLSLNDPAVQNNGVSGQRQHGVDIFGKRGGGTGPQVGIQCKGKSADYGGRVTEKELRAEVETYIARGAMSEGIDWLNAVAAHLQINERQKLALLYLRHNHRLTNSDYRRLHHGLDSREAGRELQGLVLCGAAVMKGTRGGSFYALALPPETPVIEAPASDEGRVLAYVRQHGSIQAGTCSQLLGWNSPQRAGRFSPSFRIR